MRLLSPCLVFSTLFAACGGGGEEPVEPDAALPADIQLGSSDPGGTSFVEVADGADVELVSGAQGGFHVWTSLRVSGAMGTLYLDREARRVADDKLILRASRMVIEVSEQAMQNWWEHPGALPSFMCPSPVGLSVFDEEIAFTAVILTEDEEVLAQGEMVVVPRCPTDEMAEFCAEICGG